MIPHSWIFWKIWLAIEVNEDDCCNSVCRPQKRKRRIFSICGKKKRVVFVADPELAPKKDGIFYARPDDDIPSGDQTWRDKLIEYNQIPNHNPNNLLKSYNLYRNNCYHKLAEHVGPDRLFILSAGWGLVKSSFMLPYYNITFSNNNDIHTVRNQNDEFNDFKCILQDEIDSPILFFGSKNYLNFFNRLTNHLKNPRIVFYRTPTNGNNNPNNTPEIANGRALPFATNRCTNWHYECANKFMEHELDSDIKHALDEISAAGR